MRLPPRRSSSTSRGRWARARSNPRAWIRPEASVSHPLDLGDGREVLDDREARAGQLLALGDHVRPEELVMIAMIVELVRGENGGQHGAPAPDGCLPLPLR